MNVQAIAAKFTAAVAEAGLRVTWDHVPADELQWALSVCSTESEVADELVQLFNHPANF